MNQIPSSWMLAPIGDLCDLKNGRAFKPTEWSDEGLPIVRIQNLNNKNASFNYYSGKYEEKYHLKGGELLFAWSGTPGTSFGAHVWRGGEALLNQHIFRVDFSKDFLDHRLFRHAINQQLNALISKAHGGAGLQHVTKGKFETTEIAVPPLNEQHRIADKLDTTLAHVDALKDRLARITPLLKRFRQSVLAAATSGRLTEDWRRFQKNVAWNKKTLAEICQDNRIITYGVIKLGDEVIGGVPCLRTSNVRWLCFELDGIKSIAKELSTEYGRTILQGREVLVNVRGTLGGVAVVTPEMTGWNVSREVAVVPIDESIAISEFVAIWIGTEECQRWLTGVAKGVAYTGINLEDLRTLKINLPPKKEQEEIVRRVASLFAFADSLEARLQSAQTAAERLTPALLAKAFRGELVPQDPNDEPATELLRRLREARAAQAPTKPKRGRKAGAAGQVAGA